MVEEMNINEINYDSRTRFTTKVLNFTHTVNFELSLAETDTENLYNLGKSLI